MVSVFCCFAFLQYTTNSKVAIKLYALLIASSIIRVIVATSFDSGRNLTYKNQIIINTQRIVCVIKIYVMLTNLSTISYQLRLYIFKINNKLIQNIN